MPASRPTLSINAPTNNEPRPHDAEPQKRWRPQASLPCVARVSTMASATGEAAEDADLATLRAATAHKA